MCGHSLLKGGLVCASPIMYSSSYDSFEGETYPQMSPFILKLECLIYSLGVLEISIIINKRINFKTFKLQLGAPEPL